MDELKAIQEAAQRLQEVKKAESERLQELRDKVIDVGRHVCDMAYILRVRPQIRYKKTPYYLWIVGNRGFRYMLENKPPEEQVKIARKQVFRDDDVSPLRRLRPGIQPFKGYFLLLVREGHWKAQISANTDAINERFRMIPKDNALGFPPVPVAVFMDVDKTIYLRVYHAPDNIQDLVIPPDHPDWSEIRKAFPQWRLKRIHEPGFDWEIRKHVNRLSINLLELVLDAYPMLVNEIVKSANERISRIAQVGEKAEQLAASLEAIRSALEKK